RPRLLLLGADHPVGDRAPVPGRARLEVRPGRRIAPELLFARLVERRLLPLLVSVDGRALRRCRGEGGAAGGEDTARGHQLHAPHVDGAPVAPLLARREADDVALRAEALAHAVDPADAERLVHRLRPGEAGLARRALVEADPELPRRRVMFGEPAAERLGRG